MIKNGNSRIGQSAFSAQGMEAEDPLHGTMRSGSSNPSTTGSQRRKEIGWGDPHPAPFLLPFEKAFGRVRFENNTLYVISAEPLELFWNGFLRV